MTNFLVSIDDLRDKKNLITDQLITRSFEYMLVGISESYAAANGYKDWKDFNKYNNITYFKALVYPFFVAASNGHSESLYTLFGPFIPYSFGPGSVALHDIIRTNSAKMENFKFGDPNNNKYGLQIKNDFLVSRQKIQNSIITIENEPNKEIALKNIDIYSDNQTQKSLLKAIDNGIEIIRNGSNNTFFTSGESKILKQASLFKAFQKAYNEMTDAELEYKEVAPDKNRHFYSDVSLALL
jgi:hypothetical protein